MRQNGQEVEAHGGFHACWRCPFYLLNLGSKFCGSQDISHLFAPGFSWKPRPLRHPETPSSLGGREVAPVHNFSGRHSYCGHSDGSPWNCVPSLWLCVAGHSAVRQPLVLRWRAPLGLFSSCCGSTPFPWQRYLLSCLVLRVF